MTRINNISNLQISGHSHIKLAIALVSALVASPADLLPPLTSAAALTEACDSTLRQASPGRLHPHSPP